MHLSFCDEQQAVPLLHLRSRALHLRRPKSRAVLRRPRCVPLSAFILSPSNNAFGRSKAEEKKSEERRQKANEISR